MSSSILPKTLLNYEIPEKSLKNFIFLWQWITTDKLWCRIIVDLFCLVHSALDTPVACEQTEPSLWLVGIEKNAMGIYISSIQEA